VDGVKLEVLVKSVETSEGVSYEGLFNKEVGQAINGYCCYCPTYN
jgi:hypothetical protein